MEEQSLVISAKRDQQSFKGLRIFKSTFFQTAESAHRNTISSIHQSLNPSYGRFRETRGNVRHLQHWIFPLG